MYCGQCGKKVMDNMLFCPFCGVPIVIPEQDESAGEDLPIRMPPVAAPARPQPSAAKSDAPRTISLFERSFETEEMVEPDTPQETEQPEEVQQAEVDPAPADDPFVPLSLVFDEQVAETQKDIPQPEILDVPDGFPEDFMDEVKPEPQAEERRPVRRPAQEIRQIDGGTRRSAKSYIPVRDLDPDDMFMDDVGSDEYDLDDADDAYDIDETDDYRFENEYDFEEPEHGSFFMRHIRGIVGLILLLILGVICAVWAFSPAGQKTLAAANLAWNAQAYADLGYEAYQMDMDMQAARYYEKAYSHDTTNYEYAHSAMVAYYEANEIESAATMLKKCVEMDPDNPEPYQEMLILYPDAQTRPWDITELIRLGYQRTQHEALKLD